MKRKEKSSFSVAEKNCMIIGWARRDDYWRNTSSPGFGRDRQYRGCLETRGHGPSGLIVPKKMACGCCGTVHRGYYDKTVRRIRDLSCGDARIYLEVEVRRVRCKRCGKVKREKLPWLANNPFYTKRFS
ncbi:MAG: transposase family protein [Nitrospinae bacterium]|nr:transposase family protein [Nitrospinota bacterium]